MSTGTTPAHPLQSINADRLQRMEARLRAALAPVELELIDESHKHIGHEGAKTGLGHFAVRIVSAQFSGKAPLACHRMIYAALGDMMTHDIHALRISASAPMAR